MAVRPLPLFKKNKKSICNNVCEEWKRNNKYCYNCKKYMCRVCEITYKDKYFCTDCLFKKGNRIGKMILKDIYQDFRDLFK